MSFFNARRLTKTCLQKYIAPPSTVFPLLCPVREHEWIDGWLCDMVYSESGYAEEGCIFKTQHPGGEETVWVMTKQDNKNGIVQFVRVTPGLKVVKLEIRLMDNNIGGTDAHLTYVYTALSEKGNLYIDNKAEDDFNHTMVRMEKSMNYFLKTGRQLKILAGN